MCCQSRVISLVFGLTVLHVSSMHGSGLSTINQVTRIACMYLLCSIGACFSSGESFFFWMLGYLVLNCLGQLCLEGSGIIIGVSDTPPL